MHEMSIVEALLETVLAELRLHPGARVCMVRVRIGALRLVEPTALQFCYSTAVQDTPLAGSQLQIQQVDASARCDVCSLEFPVEESWFECPRCHSANARLLQGDELLLTSFEIEQVLSSDLKATNPHVHCRS
ncbi:MAG TPA: hydrogenase maturation nickel metallochaperone HypA [Verrucomicrobiae bacterium]|nr:hydrogenase maturation nickel metallochaperone HypA [Verrucomicrobiae bacterium]